MADKKIKVLPLEPSRRGAAFSSAVFQINAEKGTRTFYVHGDILSQDSQPFKSIVDGNWAESVKREINLEEWDADTVSRMIDYLYTKDYTWQKNENFKLAPAAVLEKSPSAEHSPDAVRPLTPISELMIYPQRGRVWGCQCNKQSLGHIDKEEAFGELFLVHAKVYALANYRAIEKLSELALDRLLHSLSLFQATEYNPQQIGYIVQLVSYVYENTCSRFGKPEPIRRAVTRFIAIELTKLDSTGGISELLNTYGDFACDLFSDLTKRIRLAEVQSEIRHKYLAGVKAYTGALQPFNCIKESLWRSSNINFGTGAEPVWLVPYYTEDVDKACTSFQVIMYGQEGYDHRFKIPTNLEDRRYPCLISICDRNIQSKVSHVQLVRVTRPGQVDDIQRRCKATGVTTDILGTAHSDILHLMWK
ncbi:hypothetical protein B9Z19DRAFT_1118917 [Tuber borchii]|uniref:BTB domain-containing protein n=1 Tax=Tuber borchii TaxID=42251 RepID=A0A2T7A7A4_TUBBO|nr:hypothetical protein B9Z19DRAFT_1118917 [Tuber borchii]